MIEIQGLRKTFGQLTAVDDLSLTVESSRITALLGPNGAGKTTTLSCLVGLLEPDTGTILVDGQDMRRDPVAAKRLISYVPETATLYQALTPDEFLALRGRLFDMSEPAIASGIERLLGGFGLLDRRHEPMVGFSKGMTQKVAIAGALLTEPRVLILDEPLSGLDVQTTLVLKAVLRAFTDRGGAVLYCSHLLDVVEAMADCVAVLDQGKVQAVGSMDELRAHTGGETSRLEELFRELTRAADPEVKARELLGPPKR